MQINEILQPSKKSITEEKQLREVRSKVNSSILTEVKRLNAELSLLEDLDVRQVDGGDWMVWDTETDSAAGATRFTNPGDAEEARDNMRRSRAPGADADNDRPRDSDSDSDSDTSSSNRRRMAPRYYAAFTRYARANRILSFRRRLTESWTYFLAGAMGVTVDHTGLLSDYQGGEDQPEGAAESLEETLDVAWEYAQAGQLYNPDNLTQEQMRERMNAMSETEINEHIAANHRKYEAYQLRAYGVVVAAYMSAIFFQVLVAAPGAARGAYTGIKNVGKFIRALRTLRTASTMLVAGVGAVFGAGVGGIVTGLISFALGTAAIWLVELILTRSNLGPSIIQYIVNKTFEWDMERAAESSVHGYGVGDLLQWAALGGDYVARATADAISDVPDTTEVQRNLRDIRSELLHDPRAQSELERTVDYFPGLEQDASSTTGSNTATTTGNNTATTAAGATPDIFGASN